jgi:CheY-like chemotaxis protein
MRVFERAKGLTHQLLTFAKGGAPVRKTAPLGPLIRDCVRFALSGSNIEYSFTIDNDLWISEHDESQIGQVISNIVINAQQAMPAGGHLHIEAHNVRMPKATPALPAGDYLKISFKDSGIGIPEDIQQNIFDPFFTTKQKGQGLGLATAYSIIKKHKGTIEVESKPAQGSTFTVYLPGLVGVSSEENPSLTDSHKGEGLVIVMDDESDNRIILQKMLEDMGYSVITAPDGLQAMEAMVKAGQEGKNILALILDLTVPGGMGGMQVIRKIREKDHDIPVIASSGYSEDPVMSEPGNFGFNGKLGKPFRRTELMNLMASLKGKQ